MAYERELQLLASDRAKLMSYSDSVLNKYKQLTLWWPEEDDRYVERLVAFLYIYGHPSNYDTAGRFYVDSAIAGGPFTDDKKTYAGRWRFVGASKASYDNEAMQEALPGVSAVYRYGFADSLLDDETRLRSVVVDTIFQKRILTTEWQNINPNSVQSIINVEKNRSPTDVITNPTIDGQPFEGIFAVSSVTDDLTDEGTGLIRRRLTEVVHVTGIPTLSGMLHQDSYGKERVHPFSSSSVYLPTIDSSVKDTFTLRWKYISRSSLSVLKSLTAAQLSVFAPDATWAVAISTPSEQDDNTIWFDVVFQKEERDIDVSTHTASTNFEQDSSDETLIDQADDTPLDLTDEAGIKDGDGLYTGVRGIVASVGVNRGADGRTSKSKSVTKLKDHSMTDGEEYISQKTKTSTEVKHIYVNRSVKPELTEPYGSLSINKNQGDLYDGVKTVTTYLDKEGASEAWGDIDDLVQYTIETKDGPFETVDGYRWRYKRTVIDIKYRDDESSAYDDIAGGFAGSDVSEAMHNLIWRSVKVKTVEFGAWQVESLSIPAHTFPEGVREYPAYWTYPHS